MILYSLAKGTAGSLGKTCSSGTSCIRSSYRSKIRRDLASGSLFEGSRGSCLDGGRVFFATSMAVPVPFTSASEVDIPSAGFAVPIIPDGDLESL